MSDLKGTTSPTGTVTLKKITGSTQTAPISWRIKNFWKNTWDGAGNRINGLMTLQSRLNGLVFRPNLSLLAPEQIFKMRTLLAQNVDVRELVSPFRATVIDYGTLSTRSVTTAGVTALANNFAGGGFAISSFKFHGFGTGTNVESTSDTGLQTELTTQYAVDNTRPTGSQSSSTNIYTTIGTLSPDLGGTIAITEHGIFSAASAGTLWDRSQFAAVNLVAGSDSLQVTYTLTCNAGG